MKAKEKGQILEKTLYDFNKNSSLCCGTVFILQISFRPVNEKQFMYHTFIF
mgnify:CR=1 FL=1